MSIAVERQPDLSDLSDPGYRDADVARHGGAAALRDALEQSRQDTLAVFALYEVALPGLQVPLDPVLNPPLWELGHIGWFQEYWLARNPQRACGVRADPLAERAPALRAQADDVYNSSTVPHASRWNLALPDADATRTDLQSQLQTTLGLLASLQAKGDNTGNHTQDPARGNPPDDALYFFRLALHHEDMHHEAALYMAQALGIAVPDARWQAPVLPAPGAPLHLPGAPWQMGVTPCAAKGFAFDNEYGALDLEIPAFNMDAQAVRWQEYLPWVEAGGGPVPRYLRRSASGWEQWRHGQWSNLNLAEPACHLTWHEADAWCRWAGRRLPAEAEWDYAAVHLGDTFRWGDVWEWTATPFAPFPGFEPHPYRDYSAPWFDGRPVLRGASFMTQPRMRHRQYRNFFEAHRSDVPAGFRSCAM